MSRSAIRLHLLIALSLPLLSAPRALGKDEVILVYPGVLKTIPGPKKSAASRRNPPVGTRQTEYRLAGVSIARAVAGNEETDTRKSAASSKRDGDAAKADDGEGEGEGEGEGDAERSEEIEDIKVEKEENTIEIRAEDGAAGQLFKLTALLTVRTSEYRKFSRDEFGKKIQPYTSWVDLPEREQKQEFTLAVALGTMPHTLVANGTEMTITLPEALDRPAIKRRKRPEAEVEIEPGNRLRIAGLKPGDTEFELRYELAGKKLAAELPVRVLPKEAVASIALKDGRGAELGINEIDALFGLAGGRILRVDSIEDPAVAQIAFDNYRVHVKSLKPGRTRALLAYTGVASGKDGKRLRCQTLVPLVITVE